MGNTTFDKKLALIQQVRSSYDRNQFDLSHRERILYGKTAPRSRTQGGYYDARYRDGGYYNAANPNAAYRGRGYRSAASYPDAAYQDFDREGDLGFSFLKLRFLLAAILLAAIILLDRKGATFAGITTSEVFSVIAKDYTAEIDHLFTDAQAPQ